MLKTIFKERHKQLGPEKSILLRSDQFGGRRTPGKIIIINGSSLGLLMRSDSWDLGLRSHGYVFLLCCYKFMRLRKVFGPGSNVGLLDTTVQILHYSKDQI